MKESSLIERDTPRLESIFSSMKDQVNQLLLLLSERERFVIEKRFALGQLERSTLEEIGRHFTVTRERVRQIEKNALQKLNRNIHNFGIFEINHIAFELLEHNGGLLSEDMVLSKLLQQENSFTANALLFILSLDRRFVRLSNTISYHPYFHLSEISVDLIDNVAEYCLKQLKKDGDIVQVDELRNIAIARNVGAEILSPASFRSLFTIHKQFKLVEDRVGLMAWKHIHPRTLRDKIYFILRREEKALHFIDIANLIVEAEFDRKNVNLQAIHNELIRHEDFILIGRGIYALREWGYCSGTVADIIGSLLQKKESMSEEEIIQEVLEQRQVKPITIILNLKNKPQFTRVGRKQYALKGNRG